MVADTGGIPDMTIEPTVLREIVSEIWEGMLGLPVLPTTEVSVPRGGRQVYASVQVTGAWEGAVIIECEEVAAAAFTAALLGLEGEVPAADEVHDVMGELANMVGGNFKATVERETQLSLPTVVIGEELDLAVPGAEIVNRETFAVGEVALTLGVMARDSSSLSTAH